MKSGRKAVYPWQTWVDQLADDSSPILLTFASDELAARFMHSQSTARPLGLLLTRRAALVEITRRTAKEQA